MMGVGAPLELAEVPEPKPTPGRVIVEVKAVGLCATDLKIIDGLLGQPPALPLILGHEIAGVVLDGTDTLQPGSPVALRGLEPCGRCRRCREGCQTVCGASRHLGFHRPGGLASQISVPTDSAIAIPDTMAMADAAVTMDAVATTWRALRTRAGLIHGESVVIAGAGGLGNAAIQIAKSDGARVAAIDPSLAQRTAALEAGADVAVAPDNLEALTPWSAAGVDVGFECSGSPAGFKALVTLVSPGGRIVCNGYRPGVDYGLDSARLVLEEISVLGSRNSTLADAHQALEAVASGRIRPLVSETLDLSEVNDALERLRDGSVTGRVVVTP